MSATKWLTEQQCSELTGIPAGTLRNWRSAGINLPFARIGRLVRYSEAEVDAYMKAQQVPVTQSA